MKGYFIMILQNDYELRSFLDLLNETVKVSIKHGGDSGGPYFSNEKEVVKNLQEWINKIENDNEELINQFPLVIVYNENIMPMIAIVIK